MTTFSDPPKESFRPSMLLSDTRYRSITFQVIALALLVTAIWYLGSNLAANLRAAGDEGLDDDADVQRLL